MNKKFTQRNSKQNDEFSSFFRGILDVAVPAVIIIIIVILLITFFKSPEFALAAGMLGDPFRTTRKMKVPPHSRVGRRERNFLGFVKLCWFISLALIALAVLAKGFGG